MLFPGYPTMSHQNPAAGKEADLLGMEISCLNPENLNATLISCNGSHCEVWRSNFYSPRRDEALTPYYEFVIKYPRGQHSRREIEVLARDYRQLQRILDDVVPKALFLITRIDQEPNVCVIAEAVNIWFDLAMPEYRQDAIALLKTNPKPRIQLQRFLTAAHQWRSKDKLIDLFGINNLVMDNNREIRFLDSFFPFYFEDMLDWIEDPEDDLAHKIEVSRQRLDYLEELLAASGYKEGNAQTRGDLICR